jgi:hypothetical protein
MQWKTIALIVSGFAGPGVLARHYTDGERLAYQMTGDNDGRRYEVRADGVVKRLPNGRFIEEYAWSHLAIDGKAVSLSQASLDLRQSVTLAPEEHSPFPNLAGVDPNLIGPLTDFLTVYVDLWLAIKLDSLSEVGDHAFQSLGIPASWADGKFVTVGEDAVDFELTLKAVDRTANRATLLVRHVPPRNPAVKIPVDWMRTPVQSGTENNWVEVAKRGDAYVAAAGVETFDVTINVALSDGHIENATIDNAVDARERRCRNAELLSCSEPVARRIRRQIAVTLVR